MTKVICLGYFDRGNCGDEAFKVAHEWFFGAENIVFKNGRLSLEEVGQMPVVLGGGDVVAPFFLDWIPSGVNFDMIGVGLKYEQGSIAALRNKAPNFRRGWFRNRVDVELCEAAGIDADYIPDIVFALKESYQTKPTERVSAILANFVKPVVVVCLADHFNARDDLRGARHLAYLEFFKWELATTLDHLASDFNILFVPFSVYSQHMDHRFHYDVLKRMKRRGDALAIKDKLDPLEMLCLIHQSSHVVSMKLHGNIFGLVTKRKCINIGVGRKQQKLYEEASLGDVSLEPYSFTKDRFLRVFNTASEPGVINKVSELADKNYRELSDFRTLARNRYGLG